MSIALTGKEDSLVSRVRDLLAEESGAESRLDLFHVGLDDLLNGRASVADAELLILLTREQEPDNVVEWAAQINSEKGRVRRLVLCMPRPNARDAGLLLKHADEIINPAGFTIEHIVERVLGLLIQEKRITPYNYADETLYGATKRMRDVYRDIALYAPMREPVLILGETGTGKDLVARAIHSASTRSSKTFIPSNCTAVPKELTESHFFGHKRGAFSGARSDSIGVIRAAAGGTLFIDEIGDMSPDVQPKLLRFLQEGEIQTLGEVMPQKVDVRLIFATSHNLREDVDKGTFRRDLRARLNRVVLELPPLRERKADIPLLAEHFKDKYNSKYGTAVKLQSAAIDELFRFDWPENVRDLDNVVFRAAMKAGPDGVTDTLMYESLRLAGGYSDPLGKASAGGPFRSVVFRPREDKWRTVRDRAEAAYFRAIIEEAEDEDEALELSGMGRAQFYVILKKYGLSFNR
jgi:DNA-binding NtrC family response regulator